MNKARSRGLHGQRGIIMQKERTWNSVHLIFDYDLLLKRMKSFPTGGQAESWSHIITSNISAVLIPLQMKREFSEWRAWGKWWRAGWLKKERRWKVFFEVAFCISLLSLNPPDQAILPWPTLTSQCKNIHTHTHSVPHYSQDIRTEGSFENWGSVWNGILAFLYQNTFCFIASANPSLLITWFLFCDSLYDWNAKH